MTATIQRRTVDANDTTTTSARALLTALGATIEHTHRRSAGRSTTSALITGSDRGHFLRVELEVSTWCRISLDYCCGRRCAEGPTGPEWHEATTWPLIRAAAVAAPARGRPTWLFLPGGGGYDAATVHRSALIDLLTVWLGAAVPAFQKNNERD